MKGPVMSTIDRWGPGAISIVTLLFVVWFEMSHGEIEAAAEARWLERANGLQKQIEAYSSMETRQNGELADRISILTAHVVTLRVELARAGVKVPPMPTPVSADKEN